mgnify:CR=1 FL=1
MGLYVLLQLLINLTQLDLQHLDNRSLFDSSPHGWRNAGDRVLGPCIHHDYVRPSLSYLSLSSPNQAHPVAHPLNSLAKPSLERQSRSAPASSGPAPSTRKLPLACASLPCLYSSVTILIYSLSGEPALSSTTATALAPPLAVRRLAPSGRGRRPCSLRGGTGTL